VALAVWPLLACPVAQADPPYAGRPLTEVLEEFRARGINLLYSSDAVPATLVVAGEPGSDEPLEALAEMLADHGLSLSPVAAGTWAVVPSVRVAAGREDAAAASARPPRVALDEIVVASSRYTLAADLPDATVFLTQAELEALPRLAEESLKAVQRLPGAAGNGVSGLAHVRGGEDNETLILFEGLPLHEPFHLRNLLSPMSLLSARIVDRLEVHSGGFTAPLGDRMSAVIDAYAIRPEPDRYHELGLSLFHANAMAAHRFGDGRGQWLLSARRSNLDELSDLLDGDLGEPSYYDVYGSLDYGFSEKSRGRLDLLLSGDRFNVEDADAGESSSARYGNVYLWGTLEHRFSDSLRASAIASYTSVTTERRGTVDEPGQRAGSVDDERSYRIAGIKLDATRESQRWLHSLGVDFREMSAEYDYESVVTFEPGFPLPGDPGFSRAYNVDTEPSGRHLALYASSRVRLTDDLTAEAGLRWDHQSYNTEADADDQFGPRLNLLYEIGDSTRLRASWGRHQQFQDINELQVEDGVDAYQAAQRVDHSIVSIETELVPGLTLRAEAYRKRYASLRTRYENLFDPVVLLPELSADRIRIEPDSATADGVELLLARRTAEPWNGWLGYTWSRVEDRIDGEDVPRSWDQTHAVTAGLTWTRGPWDASLAGLWHTGWPTTSLRLDPTGGVVVGSRNAERLGDFASLDLRINRRWQLPRGELSGFLEITNLLDRRNPCCVQWSVEQTPEGTRLERRVEHWLPRIPSIGVLWTF